jgi:hypothetical protein
MAAGMPPLFLSTRPQLRHQPVLQLLAAPERYLEARDVAQKVRNHALAGRVRLAAGAQVARAALRRLGGDGAALLQLRLLNTVGEGASGRQGDASRR